MTFLDTSRQTTKVPSVGIVLLNWNGWQDTVECLSSLQMLNYSNFQILVVDNASTNKSVAEIRARFPDIEVIESVENGGFAKGNNQGIRHFLSKEIGYVWILNNDTTVSISSLSALVNKAESHDKLGIVGSVLYEYDKPWRIQAWGGGKYNAILATASEAKYKSEKIDHINGASMLIKSAVLKSAGLFDESFFFFMEDTEISLRVKDKGWQLAIADLSYVFHKGGASLDGHEHTKSIRTDLLYINAVGNFMRVRRMRLSSVILRLIVVVIRRIQRRQFDRIPQIIKAYVVGYKG